ncbi:PH-like domain-containing protein [Mycobacterium arosiense]|uniref:Transporter n=1 Tax=Mycobacterium arosiense ATCC BAA-1401 = DSM 45069 TaxID=1265311 RepID=A0A1W9Z6Y4_MYCAI|nr:transporter [Mycobacterium arosiense]ORA07827.1 transporter [Mycobacterium arosiense ATCC BAA-1401 = DSM 45069]
MNSGTLVASLIFAAVVVVVITVVIQLMMRTWHRRSQQQAELIGALPEIPDHVGAATISTRGHYCGSMMTPGWHERIAAGDLGFRSKAVLTRYAGGIMVERQRAQPIWIPRDSITEIRMERRMTGRIGILAIRWRLPSGVEIDTGFRANNRGDYDDWLESRHEEERRS